MAKNKSPKILTKKHLARQDRERRQIRLITGVAIGIIAIVFLSIALSSCTAQYSSNGDQQ